MTAEQEFDLVMRYGIPASPQVLKLIKNELVRRGCLAEAPDPFVADVVMDADVDDDEVSAAFAAMTELFWKSGYTPEFIAATTNEQLTNIFNLLVVKLPTHHAMVFGVMPSARFSDG